MLEKLEISKYFDIAVEGVLNYTPKIVGAIFVLWIGFKIVNSLGNLIEKILKKQKIDKTVNNFLISLFKNVLKALVFVALFEFYELKLVLLLLCLLLLV